MKRTRRIKQRVSCSPFMRLPLCPIFIDPMGDSALMNEIYDRCCAVALEQDLLVLQFVAASSETAKTVLMNCNNRIFLKPAGKRL